MERTATIPLWEYDNLRETVKRLTDERTAAEKRNAELESQLSQIRDIAAPAEDEPEAGSEPEPTFGTAAVDLSFGDWGGSASVTCGQSVTSILYNGPIGSH